MKNRIGFLKPLILIILFLFFHLPTKGDSTDSPQQEIDKLQKDLLKPEIALLAATKLLEMKNPKAFEVVEKSFASSAPDIQIQIIRAIRFKKDVRGFKFLMPSFAASECPDDVRKEIGKTLEEFTSNKEVLEYLFSLISANSPSYPLNIRFQALHTLKELVKGLAPSESLSYYHRLVKGNLNSEDILSQRIYREITMLTGKTFKSFSEFDLWWNQNKDKSQVDWWHEVKNNLEDRLQKSEQETFFWWKKYLESIQNSDPALFMDELIKGIEKNENPYKITYTLSKLQTDLTLKDEERNRIILVLIQLLEQNQNPLEIRRLSVQVLGKVALNVPGELSIKAQNLLISIFEKSLDPQIRILACNSLSSFKSKEILASFLKSLRDKKEPLEVIQEVIRNLGAFEENKENIIVKSILYRLELTYGTGAPSSDVNHSELLALSIEKLGQFSYYDPGLLKKSNHLLHLFLKHKNMKIRYFASNSLGKIGTPESVEHLLKALETSETEVEGNIISAVLSIHKSRSAEISQNLMKTIIQTMVIHYKNPKLKKKIESALSIFIGNSLELMEYSVKKVQEIYNGNGTQKSHYALLAKILEPLDSDTPPDPAKKDLYWKLKIELARAYLLEEMAEKALKIYQSCPNPSLPIRLETVQALVVFKKMDEAEKELEKIEKELNKDTIVSAKPALMKILDLLEKTNPSSGLKLVQKWKEWSFWSTKEKEELMEIQKKLEAKLQPSKSSPPSQTAPLKKEEKKNS